jgi:hypothetical protein
MKNSQKHPVPDRNAVRRFTEKFRETGSVLDGERNGRQSEFIGTKMVDISDSMLRSASKSSCRLVHEKDVGFATGYKAVRDKLNIFLYKVTGSGLYRRPSTSHPAPFTTAQRVSGRTVPH